MYLAIRDTTLQEARCDNVAACAKGLDVGSLELSIDRAFKGLQYDLSEEKERRRLLDELGAKNLSICAVLLEVTFGEKFDSKDKQWIIDSMELASDIGVRVVRVGSVGSVGSECEWAINISNTIKQILAETERLDTILAMENHGQIGNRKGFLKRLLDEIDDERFKLTLDVGNLYWYGYPLDEVYGIVKEFAPEAAHTHLKNFTYPENRRQIARGIGEGYPDNSVPLPDGDIDFGKVIEILAKRGYVGDLTIEEESLGRFPQSERMDILRRDVVYLGGLLPRSV